MKRILLLGATGSIGLQTVDVIEQHPDKFCLVGIAAGHQADVMQKIIDKHPSIQVAGISDVSKANQLKGVKIFSGTNAMVDCIENCYILKERYRRCLSQQRKFGSGWCFGS